MLRLFQQFLLFLIISYTDAEPIQGQKFLMARIPKQMLKIMLYQIITNNNIIVLFYTITTIYTIFLLNRRNDIFDKQFFVLRLQHIIGNNFINQFKKIK